MTFTTSELAKAANVGNQTLRYYERRGLLPEPPRTEGGHRIYGRPHLERLRFIQQFQDLGFPLDDIHALLKLHEDRGLPRLDSLLDTFLARIDEKAAALDEARAVVEDLRARQA